MDRQPPGLNFALLGHQDSWERVEAFVRGIRAPDLEVLPLDKIREIFPWIPPRISFHIQATSTFDNRTVEGAYIETFIPPDKLQPSSLPGQLQRVLDAGACARAAGAGIVGLGGFTSIILEGRTAQMEPDSRTHFTTGNTLTAVYVVKGVEVACALRGIDLAQSRLLVIGASGDIGSACVRYFRGRVREILLNARRAPALAQLQTELTAQGQASRYDTHLGALLPEADIVVAAASTTGLEFSPAGVSPRAIICDAGYPKNFLRAAAAVHNALFHGGMGQMRGGFRFIPAYAEAFYRYPAPYVGHGCLFEAMLLAMEGRYESYSSGRGLITPERMETLWRLAQKHGLVLAPLFNHNGLWPEFIHQNERHAATG